MYHLFLFFSDHPRLSITISFFVYVDMIFIEEIWLSPPNLLFYGLRALCNSLNEYSSLKSGWILAKFCSNVFIEEVKVHKCQKNEANIRPASGPNELNHLKIYYTLKQYHALLGSRGRQHSLYLARPRNQR